MAFSYKTPGAYIEEIVKLPPSVAQVETAIPLFMGVTSFATDMATQDLIGVSKKINSLADFEFYFGSPDIAKASVMVKLNLPASASLAADYNNNLYYSIKHFFDNGGGPCYVHSIGKYDRAGVDVNTYKNELEKLDLVDEVTLVVIPDIAGLSKDQAYDIYNNALLKASILQDKFVLIDVRNELKVNKKVDVDKSKTEFRSTISSNADSIKYGGAYFPHLQTTYSYNYDTAQIALDFEADVIAKFDTYKFLKGLDYNIVKSIFQIYSVVEFFNDDYFKNISKELASNKVNEITRKTTSILPALIDADKLKLDTATKALNAKMITQAAASANPTFNFDDTAKEKTNLLKLLTDAAFGIANTSAAGATKTQLNTNGITFVDYVELKSKFLDKITSFFNSIFEAKLKDAFNAIPLYLPPSPAIAGVYAYVDRNRGVWKAPANVSLNSTIAPKALLSDLDQENFNVDDENGKSINCIRNFVGRGNIVWGARTLAGNNNEWRYINVRRLFNMVEESCQNASRQFVFEPNDANTWVRVKGMIDNFLTNLWRAGALQGAKPEHAFYTAVGLNQTMTQDDILNGLLIVEIGLAAVRPAEFIILRFSHKLAVS